MAKTSGTKAMFDSLSPKQKDIVFEKDGLFAVRACPGSGKTYSVAARLAHQIESWSKNYQGIATLSFTNVAWQKIAEKLSSYFCTRNPIQYPHFLGTIDSFINRFLFLPFGHLVMECRERPILVGAPHGSWVGLYYSDQFFDNISYDIDGRLYPINPRRMSKKWENNPHIARAKRRLTKLGFATQDDAAYFGMLILRSYPRIARALACRFPMLIIDEAQDTSATQMRIVDSLIEHGLKQIMLVGDPDQAIFEWNDAEPHLFNDKFHTWGENSVVLNENRRSSQAICDFTFRLSSLAQKSVAISDEVKDLDIFPQIVTYDLDCIETTIEYFLQLCEDNEIEITPETVAVAFRSKGMFCTIAGINEIAPRDMPWIDKDPYCRDFARARYLCDNSEYARGFRLIERTLVKLCTESHYCSREDLRCVWEDIGFVTFRKGVSALTNMLPKSDSDIGEWVRLTNANLQKNRIEELLSLLDTSKLEFAIHSKKGGLSFRELFPTDTRFLEELTYRLGTIHSMKGETFDAILVILKQKGLGPYYRTLLKKRIPIEKSEELRIVYVGITRPRKLLVLAVPDEANRRAWEETLLGGPAASRGARPLSNMVLPGFGQ